MDAAEKYSVLVVDDEPDMLFSLRGLLRREFEVFTAGLLPPKLRDSSRAATVTSALVISDDDAMNSSKGQKTCFEKSALVRLCCPAP